tara:strand:- start:42 stop:179 length:138 start_codon:yes stop_codon:yes gene_type:complete
MSTPPNSGVKNPNNHTGGNRERFMFKWIHLTESILVADPVKTSFL